MKNNAAKMEISPETVGLYEISAAVAAGPGGMTRMAVAQTGEQRPTLNRQRDAAVVLLHQLLCVSFSRATREWLLTRTASGAPRLTVRQNKGPGLRISFSHCEAWLAVGVSTEMGVGVDIQTHSRDRDTAGLAAFLEWPAEAGAVESFYHRWTLWEAYSKCREQPLLAPVGPEFEFLSTPAARQARSTWHAFDLPISSRVYATLVVRTRLPQVLTLTKLAPNSICPW